MTVVLPPEDAVENARAEAAFIANWPVLTCSSVNNPTVASGRLQGVVFNKDRHLKYRHICGIFSLIGGDLPE